MTTEACTVGTSPSCVSPRSIQTLNKWLLGTKGAAVMSSFSTRRLEANSPTEASPVRTSAFCVKPGTYHHRKCVRFCQKPPSTDCQVRGARPNPDHGRTYVGKVRGHSRSRRRRSKEPDPRFSSIFFLSQRTAGAPKREPGDAKSTLSPCSPSKHGSSPPRRVPLGVIRANHRNTQTALRGLHENPDVVVTVDPGVWISIGCGLECRTSSADDCESNLRTSFPAVRKTLSS